jgi:hypothetical protein
MENEELKEKVMLETTEDLIYRGEFVGIDDNFIQIRNPKCRKIGDKHEEVDLNLWDNDEDIIYNLNIKYVKWYCKYKKDIDK